MTLLQEAQSLKQTPLYDRHVSLQAKIVDFSGWSMPVYYTSILAEHRWTRESCSIFDVSHLGEIHVKGPGAFQFLQYRLTNDMTKLKDGKIIYSLLCDERGGTLDDILVYQNKLDDYYLIVNAGSIERDYEALSKYVPDSVTLTNFSDKMACIAIQGPKSEAILEKIFKFNLKDLDYYYFKEEKFSSETIWISRSGYTGEDGFEIFASNALIAPIWDKLISEGKAEGVLPAGLGARNTLRLEAGNVLYGHELDTTISPIEAGLLWAVSFKKGGFIGRDMLIGQKDDGPKRKLVGFKVNDKPIARENYRIFKDGHRIGVVTSGSFGPSVGQNIGLALLETKFSQPGTSLEIEIHGKLIPAETVSLPFVPLKHKKALSKN